MPNIFIYLKLLQSNHYFVSLVCIIDFISDFAKKIDTYCFIVAVLVLRFLEHKLNAENSKIVAIFTLNMKKLQ